MEFDLSKNEGKVSKPGSDCHWIKYVKLENLVLIVIGKVCKVSKPDHGVLSYLLRM